jgi:lipopolysaccharide/colanic/teichoic acid biosynthesis glycosyltransferase
VEVEERVHTEPSLAPSARQQVKGGFYRRYGKRLMDIVLSLCALVLLSPLMLVVALLVRIKLGSPVIFRQERPGLNEKIFTLYKFRTMTDERDENGKLLPDKIRLTRFGRWLRSSSLDELPELLNILKGDMSFVGPRPLLAKYLPLYNEKQRRRHEVRPGITGYAQTNGRNSVPWEERFELDVEYVDHVTFLGDVKIIIATVLSVIRREGIDSSETATVTMEEFKGTQGD